MSLKTKKPNHSFPIVLFSLSHSDVSHSHSLLFFTHALFPLFFPFSHHCLSFTYTFFFFSSSSSQLSLPTHFIVFFSLSVVFHSHFLSCVFFYSLSIVCLSFSVISPPPITLLSFYLSLCSY